MFERTTRFLSIKFFIALWNVTLGIDPDDFFAIPGINSATYNGKKFKTVFKETISKDFDDPIKTYTKKINAAIVKASE